MTLLKRLWPAMLGLVALLGLWQGLVVATGVPGYVLPSPLAVVQALAAHHQLLWHHTGITVIEIVAGLFIGCLSGLLTALALARFHGLRRTLLPILLISQAIPLFALAPILMLWLGYGMTAKIVMATLIIYFPVASTCYDGLRQTPQGWLDLAQTLGADRRRRLLRIQLPAALPALASGMRMAASAAPIGAVIGEWVGSSQGLGYLMLNANARMQVDLMFAALLILVTFGVALYFAMDALMRHLMPWHEDRTSAQG
ncbi:MULTISPECIES: ABC transporter permease [Chromohalobacter]|uniref:Binding-protein-dependent transport systems inner membrane component n=1 Tax=Chromohalobacter israelensis (strain ATCC BAA-138 / DSM 3043 / CIP 106854 / NCIMB 13768 / 1H11) TaxID=290398 RepID=Q1QW73_CHRI1|nr:ABC transporter permease [Chromohalobacter salexigens]ABE59285.1 binding-protein-dependent transport systems inner membrane component [Chromohalobacter salexigens DSM 3043]